ncbi:MAG: hypothetical protein WKF40_07520 [Thermoleophilaceae bacterium]
MNALVNFSPTSLLPELKRSGVPRRLVTVCRISPTLVQATVSPGSILTRSAR